MKKYILNLLPQREKMPVEVMELSMLIGLYNQEQPEVELTNWLYNNLSGQYFVFHSPARSIIDIQYRDEYRRAGTIECVKEY